ncbi:MAG TPA: HAD-IIIA family hydrolase [Thermoanaerobaculia bacterium]|nr:HAD-IIIA family hydrolase [Thermoanaerobaculia bacterium]
MHNDATRIRWIVSDVDGVWTDGKIIYMGDTREVKEFNVRDGLAVKIAQKAGLQIGVITSRRSQALERRCSELGITTLIQSAANKLFEMQRLAEHHKITLDEILYVGDDLPDLAPIHAAGISAAPADAAPEVLAAASWRLTSRGGQGAFRELVERLLRNRGDWERIVQDFHVAKINTSNV